LNKNPFRWFEHGLHRRLAEVTSCDLSTRDIIGTLGSVSVLHQQAFNSELIARYLPATPLNAALKDPGSARVVQGRFGFRWFLPQLTKHKPVLRDELIASLFIQLSVRRAPFALFWARHQTFAPEYIAGIETGVRHAAPPGVSSLGMIGRQHRGVRYS
jgi:hypothetical protein